MNSFLNWVGGKNSLKKEIIKRFPISYTTYVEPFGGAGWVLFAIKRKPKTVEVYNDLNSELVNLFKQVKYHSNEVARELELLLISKEFFEYFKAVKGLTEIQRAARFLYVIKYSFGGMGGYFSTGILAGSARSIINMMSILYSAQERLAKTLIENLDFEQCIKKYDSTTTLFYCDPPYTKGKDYKDFGLCFEWKDHLRLFETLKGIKGKFILSYNDDEKIRELYSNYIIEELKRVTGINRKNIKNNYFNELLIMNFHPDSETKL